MAPKKDRHWREKRAREDEKEQEFDEARRKKSTNLGSAPVPTVSEDELNERMSRAEKLIEQVHGLYRQYFIGVENRPPFEQRRQLDQLMTGIQYAAKPTTNQRFMAQNMLQKYRTFTELWERKLKERESS